MEEDLICVQPIDVWVRKIASKAKIIDDPEEKDEIVRKNIVEACLDSGVSVIKFNQGAWYLGHNSFDILIDNLERI